MLQFRFHFMNFSIYRVCLCFELIKKNLKIELTCTVALAINAIEAKIFSFRFKLHPIPIIAVTNIRTMNATIKMATLIYTTSRSSSLNLRVAPVIPKRMGSNTIQRISNAVDAGLSSISHPSLLQDTREKKATATQARGPAPPNPISSLPKTEAIPPVARRRILMGTTNGSFRSGI